MFVEKTSTADFSQKFLTEEEFNTLKELNTSTQDLITKLGQLEYQKQIISDQKRILIEEFNNIRTSETNFTKSLQDKYGVVSINIETGEITSLG